MATLMKMPSGLVAHRRWEDIVSMILGAAILVSPMFIEAGLTPTIVAATALAGAAIIVLAALEQLSLRRWEEILELACGVWVMVAPFALNYGGMLRSARRLLCLRSWNSGRTVTATLACRSE